MPRYRNLQTNELFFLAEGEPLPAGIPVIVTDPKGGPLKPVGRWRVQPEPHYIDADGYQYPVGSVIELYELPDGTPDTPAEGWIRVPDSTRVTKPGEEPDPEQVRAALGHIPEKRVRWLGQTGQAPESSERRSARESSRKARAAGVES
jgi:hypothetical protein